MPYFLKFRRCKKSLFYSSNLNIESLLVHSFKHLLQCMQNTTQTTASTLAAQNNENLLISSDKYLNNNPFHSQSPKLARKTGEIDKVDFTCGMLVLRFWMREWPSVNKRVEFEKCQLFLDSGTMFCSKYHILNIEILIFRKL